MIRTLLGKQMMEIFRAYFYDAKKNKKRTKIGTFLFFAMYVVIMVGILGGMFSYLALSICGPLIQEGMGWLYFALMGVIATALGAFGSVFNTYAGLYLSKDNDLLLSMPIPVRSILVARLLGVFLMGFMYSAVGSIPAVIVYWVVCGTTVLNVIGSILYVLCIAVFVLVLSCILGWAVAKISLKLKNRSVVTVLISLIFIGLYYFVYFKAQQAISLLLMNAQEYGEKIKGSAYIFYLFGKMGEGEGLAIVVMTALIALCAAVTYVLLSRSFLRIATTAAATSKTKYTEKKVRAKSTYSAIVAKEFGRFTSSSGYMLNCSLGTVFLPVIGVMFLIKGAYIKEVLNDMFESMDGASFVLACMMVCFALVMNNSTSAAVSLEGKSIWIAHSLPVPAEYFLKAKMAVQVRVTLVPSIFACVCLAIAWKSSLVETIVMIALVVAMVYLIACVGLVMNLLFPNMNWTSEINVVKQSLAVFVTLFGSWIYIAIWIGLFLMVAWPLGAVPYLIIVTAVTALIALLLFLWIKKIGCKKFVEL